MKARLLLLVVVGAAGAGGYYAYRHAGGQPGDPRGQIRVSGNIEATEVQVAFKIPGRVIERDFDEGQMVRQGDRVAVLEDADLRETVAVREAELKTAEYALDELLAGSRVEDIAAAKAAWEKADHTLKDLEAGSRPQEIAAAEAAVDAALADMARLAADLKRSTALYRRNTISAEEYDAARAAYDMAVARHRQAVEQLKLTQEGYRKEQIEAARAALQQAKAQYDLVKAGPRKEDIDQGRGRVDQARASLRQAQIQVSYATVFAPLSGVVLSKNIEPGDYVAPGTGVITVGDLVNVWLRAYIDESDNGRVRVGQTAWITTDAFPGRRFKGYVSFISPEAEFTPKNVQTQKERVKLVYRIKINLSNPQPGKELNPGIPADAVIETQ
jgi:HlyD family secretion protein